MVDLAIVHFACFLGEFRADIVGILGEMITKFLELGADFLFLRRNHRDRRRCGRRYRLRRCLGGLDSLAPPLCSCGQPRRHDRLINLGRATVRAAYEAAFGLLVVGSRILEPALKFVALLADECVAYYSAPRTT